MYTLKDLEDGAGPARGGYEAEVFKRGAVRVGDDLEVPAAEDEDIHDPTWRFEPDEEEQDCDCTHKEAVVSSFVRRCLYIQMCSCICTYIYVSPHMRIYMHI